MKFSERVGIVKVKHVIQVDDINKELRNSLWNVFFKSYMEDFQTASRERENLVHVTLIFKRLWWHYWNKEMDQINLYPPQMLYFTKEYFFSCKWWEVYEFLEATITFSNGWKREGFILVINDFLKSHQSGYRIIENKFSPIVDEVEIKEIQVALDNSYKSNLEGVNIHLKSALTSLSLKPVADYRTSIKESISSVEAICKVISNDEKAELGKSLSILLEKINIHKALVSGFKSIYGFTSDEGGIRHALMEESTLDQEDAIFMLVTCSAFINYLIVKKNKAGI